MRVLVFGDSITQGFYDSHGGWVERLRSAYNMLEAKEPAGDGPILFNLGISGDMTANVVKRFAVETENRRTPKQDFAFVFAIGINDSYLDGQKEVSTPEMYAEALDTLFAAAGHYSDKILFVGLTACDETRTTPVAWRDISYTNQRIWQFEEVLRKFCKANQLPHVKVFEKFQATQKEQNLLTDGLHPNDAGHQLIAELVSAQLKNLLN